MDYRYGEVVNKTAPKMVEMRNKESLDSLQKERGKNIAAIRRIM